MALRMSNYATTFDRSIESIPNKQWYSSNSLPKRKRVIHVTIRPSSNTGKKQFLSTIPSTLPSRSLDTSSRPVKEDLSNDLRSIHQFCYVRPAITNKMWNNDWKSNEADQVVDHHRKKKTKHQYQRRCCFISLCSILIGIIIGMVLVILLVVKPMSNNKSHETVLLRWNNSGITIIGMTGVLGSNSTQLHHPYNVAFDSYNTLHVADTFNHRIQKLINGTNMCETIAGQVNGIPGNSPSHLDHPVDILFNANDTLYITDRENNRTQLWFKNATSAVTIAGSGSSPYIRLSHPTSIASDPVSEIIYIASMESHEVISFPTGVIVAGGNGPGNNFNQLHTPYGLAYDFFSKSFVISNHNTNNIVRWALEDNNRTHLVGSINGSSGSISTLLRHPMGLVLDPMGNIYVADTSNHRIQMFLADQSSGTTIAGITGSSGTNSTQLSYPYGLRLDSQLNLYVSDTYNHRIQKFLRY